MILSFVLLCASIALFVAGGHALERRAERWRLREKRIRACIENHTYAEVMGEPEPACICARQACEPVTPNDKTIERLSSGDRR